MFLKVKIFKIKFCLKKRKIAIIIYAFRVFYYDFNLLNYVKEAKKKFDFKL